MIELKSINCTGYFSYGQVETLPLNELGLTLLEGKNLDRNGGSNGSGKTSMMNALTQILFGQNPTEWAADDITNRTLGRRWGRVVFSDATGTAWRVTETRKWRKSDAYPCHNTAPCDIHAAGERYAGSDVYFDRWDGGKWVDERATGAAGAAKLTNAYTRAKIVRILQVDYSQFMSIVYMPQQETLKFLSGTHKTRMEVFAKLADLSAWDDRRERIKTEYTALEAVQQAKTQTLIRLQTLTPTLPTTTDYDIIDQKLLLLEQQLQSDRDAIDAAEQEHNEHDAIKAALTTEQSTIIAYVKTLIQDKNAKIKQLTDISDKYSKLAENVRQEPTPIELTYLNVDIENARNTLNIAKYNLEQLLTGSGKCPRCRTNVTFDHIDRQRELLKYEISEATTKLGDLVKRYEELYASWNTKLTQQIQDITDQSTQERAGIVEGIDIINMMEDVNNSRLDAIREEMAGCDNTELVRKISTLNSSVYTKNTDAYGLRASRAALDDQKAAHDKYGTALAAAEAEVAVLESRIKLLRTLERMFGDKGVKAYKLERTIAQVNTILHRNISEITDGAVKVYITPFKKKSDGDNSIDIQIMVSEGPKVDVPIELYSGGEKQQIVLALIDAFSQYASSQTAGFNILCLDEVFGPLDRSNSNLIFEYLEKLKSTGRSSIFITTHSSDIRNELKFDRVWTVVKENHQTKVLT